MEIVFVFGYISIVLIGTALLGFILFVLPYALYLELEDRRKAKRNSRKVVR